MGQKQAANSFSVRKHKFLKAFAVFLMEDPGSDPGKSIWVSSQFDSTPQCWNVRMSKFKLRATKLFEDAKFPDEPSDPLRASEQGSQSQ
jgi:hypothetical protein